MPTTGCRALRRLVRAADIAIGHLEVPHTTRGTEMKGDVPAPGAPPANLDAIAGAGFDALTLAGNHIADCGAEGIEDTIVRLERLGVAHSGAGSNLEAARRPMFLDCHGRRIAVLSYNCVGPENAWATARPCRLQLPARAHRRWSAHCTRRVTA